MECSSYVRQNECLIMYWIYTEIILPPVSWWIQKLHWNENFLRIHSNYDWNSVLIQSSTSYSYQIWCCRNGNSWPQKNNSLLACSQYEKLTSHQVFNDLWTTVTKVKNIEQKKTRRTDNFYQKIRRMLLQIVYGNVWFSIIWYLQQYWQWIIEKFKFKS